MILNSILVVLTLLIAYFHFNQGLFSATISAILAFVAAAVALGSYEQLAPMLAGKMPDFAASVSILIIFSLVYFIPRLIIDGTVPGNVRFPATLDKVGAGAMGLLVGLVSVGVFAVAVQAMPWGTAIGGYSRYEVKDQTGMFQGLASQEDTSMFDVITDSTLDASHQNSLWLKQDDLAVGLENKVSDGGSLAGERSIYSIHPDLIGELAAQRMGIQLGARHSVQLGKSISAGAKVIGCYTQPQISQVDGEPTTLRPDSPPVAPVLKAGEGQTLLILRVAFSGKDLADGDNNLRISPGAIRLVAGRQSDQGSHFRDYHPIGTLAPYGIAVAYHVDDFLIIPMGGTPTVDFIFSVDNDYAFTGDVTKLPLTLADGTFLEIKRYILLDLSGQKVNYGPLTNPSKQGIMRVLTVQDALDKVKPIALLLPPGYKPLAQPGGSVVGNALVGKTGLTFKEVAVGSTLFAPVDSNSGNDSGTVNANGAAGTFTTRQWTHLDVSPTSTLKQLAGPGDDDISTLAARSGRTLVQVHFDGPPGIDNASVWEWAQHVSEYALVDADGKTYKPIGVVARVQHRADIGMAASFDSMGKKLEPLGQPQGRPTDVWMYFAVPTGKSVEKLDFSGQPVADSLSLRAE